MNMHTNCCCGYGTEFAVELLFPDLSLALFLKGGQYFQNINVGYIPWLTFKSASNTPHEGRHGWELFLLVNENQD